MRDLKLSIRLRRGLTVALSILTAITAAGCAASATPAPAAPAGSMPKGCTKAGPVVFAVSGRGDSPVPGVTARMASAIVQATIEGSPIGVVSIDGVPALTGGHAFADPDAGNGDARHSDEETFEAAVYSEIVSTRATAPHADVLDALQVAGQAIRAACGHGGTIYLEDSGLQETGQLNFLQPDLLSAAPDDVVRFLRRGHELPSLKGITVWLTGIGDTSPPQRPLSISEQRNLLAIWTAVARAGGAKVFADPSPRSGKAPAHVPAVLLVPLPRAPRWEPGHWPISFPDSGTVGFEPDEAVFRDPAAARDTLRRLADYLTSSPATRILLTGTTARWGTEAGDIALSRARAQAVERVLVEFGVSGARIKIRGLGWRFPGYVNDQAPGGGLLPGPAEHNRSVIVTRQ